MLYPAAGLPSLAPVYVPHPPAGRLMCLGNALFSVAKAVTRATLGLFSGLAFFVPPCRQFSARQFHAASEDTTRAMNQFRRFVSPSITPPTTPQNRAPYAAQAPAYFPAPRQNVDMLLNQELQDAEKQTQAVQGDQYRFLELAQACLKQCAAKDYTLNGYQYGQLTIQGNVQNQDRMCAFSSTILYQGKKKAFTVFGVFDGHGGKGAEVAQYVSVKLQDVLEEKLRKSLASSQDEKSAIYDALKNTCEQLQKKVLRHFNGQQGGTTASFVLLLGNDIWTANVGDSRTVLLTQDQEALQLSYDQKAADPKYRQAIQARGGFVQLGGDRLLRLNGQLAALGIDVGYGNGCTGTPGITCKPVPKEGGRIIIGSDGLFDVCPTSVLAEGSFSQVGAGRLAQGLASTAHHIFKNSIQQGQGQQRQRPDDVSVFVVELPSQIQQDKKIAKQLHEELNGRG